MNLIKSIIYDKYLILRVINRNNVEYFYLNN